MRIGSGYLGSPDPQISVAGQEIIPPKPAGWTRGYQLYKFSFENPNQDCHIIINNGNPIYLPAGKGFTMDVTDAPIYSFKIVENGITYYWIGAF